MVTPLMQSMQESTLSARNPRQHTLDIVGSAAGQSRTVVTVPDERRLAALSELLAEPPASQSHEEASVMSRELRAIGAAISGGLDPLGTEFLRLRSSDIRRALGAIYTPPHIVEAMVEWAAAEPGPPPSRIVDPGSGSGRFLMLASRVFPEAQLIAAETDHGR